MKYKIYSGGILIAYDRTYEIAKKIVECIQKDFAFKLEIKEVE